MLTNMLAESGDRVTSLQWSPKHEKLQYSGPLRLNIGPMFDKYMEWGFCDGSVRFFAADSKKAGHLHSYSEWSRLTDRSS